MFRYGEEIVKKLSFTFLRFSLKRKIVPEIQMNDKRTKQNKIKGHKRKNTDTSVWMLQINLIYITLQNYQNYAHEFSIQ